MTEGTFQAKMVRLHRPNARREVGHVELPKRLVTAHNTMLREGLEMGLELLPDNHVYLWIEDDERDHAISIVDNESGLNMKVAEMLEGWYREFCFQEGVEPTFD